jgi:hypothetical protein
MKVIAVLLVLAAIVPMALSACPNACSSHGSCGEMDECKCFANWEGGDCSQRICPYAYSWITTQQGDLNFDGDLNDGTARVHDRRFNAGPSASYLITPHAPNGDWETWPDHHDKRTSGRKDEGHFYMECANKGICNRKTGICECFEGYEGVKCDRTSCPGNCNGHGICQTIAQFAAETTYTYALWDKDMERSCKCDAGYTGPACNERICPKGDDPLTKVHQVDEVQYIDIYSNCQSSGVDAACTGDLAGNAKFSFTDHLGQTYTTGDVAITHKQDATTTVATAVKNALLALPNKVIPSVTVEEQYCESALQGFFANFAAASSNGGTPSTYMRCPTDTGHANVVYESGAGAVVGTYSATGDDVSCNAVHNDRCIRLKVTFTGNSGPQNLLSVDVTGVTRGGQTNAQDITNKVLITSTVTKGLVLAAETAATFDYVKDNQMIGVATWSGATLTVVGTPTTKVGSFPANTKVKVLCGGSNYDLGTYTISTKVADVSALADTNTIVLKENMPTDTVCGDGTDNTMAINIEVTTKFIKTNIDLSTLPSMVGQVVETAAGTAASENPKTTVESFQFAGTEGEIILKDGSFGYTANRATATTANGLVYNGAGTKENAECSDRGICNTDDGTCKCFKGYSGDACSSQNALAT